MQQNVWLGSEAKCQWPMINSPLPGVGKSPSASKAGSTTAKSRIQNLPIKDSHVGSQQVRALHTATLLTGSETWTQVCTEACRAPPPRLHCQLRRSPQAGGTDGVGGGVPWNSRDSKLIHHTGSHPCPKETAYLNLNLNFKIEGKNSLYVFSFSQKRASGNSVG